MQKTSATNRRGVHAKSLFEIIMKNKATSGLLLLILAQTMVGINIVTSKFLIADIPVLILLEIRFALACVILLPIHWITKAKEHNLAWYYSTLSARDGIYIFAQAVCAGVLFNCLMMGGLNYTDANVAGIITSALPAMIAIMSWIILKEKISFQKSLCVAFASFGLIVIAYGKLKGSSGVHSFLGDFLIFLSLLPEASYYVLCKLYKNRLPVFLTSSLLNGINALILLPILFNMSLPAFEINQVNGLLILLLGLTTGLFYVFWFLGALRVDGIMASLSTAAMPVSTVILSWFFLHEDLSLLEFSGMGLVIFSIILYARS